VALGLPGWLVAPAWLVARLVGLLGVIAVKIVLLLAAAALAPRPVLGKVWESKAQIEYSTTEAARTWV